MNNEVGSSYLPKHFWYDGMNKIKAGKGYRNGIPLGVKSGPCKECDGEIIAIKICTSSKGFETTTEKVCNKCGLVYPTSFQIIDKIEEDYTTRPYQTHEDWLRNNKPTDILDGIDQTLEYECQVGGTRPSTDDDISFGPNKAMFKNENDYNPRLAKAIKRLSKTPQSKRQPMKEWRANEYHEIARDYIHAMQLNRGDSSDVHYFIDKLNFYFGRYKADEIIYHLCLIVGKKDLRKYNGYNKNLIELIKGRLGI